MWNQPKLLGKNITFLTVLCLVTKRLASIALLHFQLKSKQKHTYKETHDFSYLIIAHIANKAIIQHYFHCTFWFALISNSWMSDYCNGSICQKLDWPFTTKKCQVQVPAEIVWKMMSACVCVCVCVCVCMCVCVCVCVCVAVCVGVCSGWWRLCVCVLTRGEITSCHIDPLGLGCIYNYTLGLNSTFCHINFYNPPPPPPPKKILKNPFPWWDSVKLTAVFDSSLSPVSNIYRRVGKPHLKSEGPSDKFIFCLYWGF